MFEVADRLKNVKVSASAAMTRKVRELRAQGVKVIGLSSGEPDFPTPPHAIEAAHKAALAGDTKYPPQDGVRPLKEAIRAKFKRDNKLDYALEEIMVSNGSKQIMYDALMASVNPGDEVIIPAPGWISYADQAVLAGATPVPVSCPENNQFKLRAADLDAVITAKTKWVVLNFPNNPTGAVCSRAEMRQICDVLLKHPHVLVMADDIYEHLIYDDFGFCTVAEVEPAGRDGEDRVAILRRMDGTDRADQPVLRHDRQPLGRRLVQPGVGRHCSDGRVGAGVAAGSVGGIVRKIGAVVRHRQTEAARRRRQAAELLALLQRPGPKLRHVAHGRVAPRIDGHEGTDLKAARRINRRGTAETALEITGLGAEPGAGIAQRKIPRRPAGRVVG